MTIMEASSTPIFSGGELVQWLTLLVAVFSGVITGIGFCVGRMNKLAERILTLELKVGARSVEESLKMDRHDHVYPMLQERIVLPLDILEKQVNQHNSSLAILQERDRIASMLENFLRRMEKKPDHG